ncbi:TetR/AcrR family transcriptional regulator [Lysinibacillus sp. 3P01SB]|uniref:TetR/AcrR family transcriptional regulator n=1 Tax=Lysinibacillus sp. 3P01SB TaxID=3132284 RepID=UPI0039A586D6
MARGRRVNSSGERSKQLLLEKAIELFSAHGYHQTKISDIVKAANLTQPTFYLYFHSKESLFNDLNSEFQTNLYEIFNDGLAQLEGRENIRTQVFNMLKEIFSYFVQNPNLTKIGFYESVEAEAIKNELVNRLVEAVSIHNIQFSMLHHVDTRIFIESLLGSMERLTLTNLLTEKRTPEMLAEDIINIYFAEQEELVR